MKKRLVISLVLVGLLAFGAGLGTYAWFTSSATSTDNIFTTGTLSVNCATPSTPGTVTVTESDSVVLGNLQPGDKQSFSFDVSNTGSLNMQYRFKLDNISGDLSTGSHPLKVSFDNGTTWINIADSGYVGTDGTLQIATGGPAVPHTVLVELPTSADNFYQGKTVTFKVVIEATQVGNSTWAQ